MDMKTLRKKQNRYRGLRAVSYLLGFPLLLLVVFVASVPFLNGDAFTDVKYYGVIACAAIWVVCIIGQIVISLITKSNTGRTLFMLVLSLILTVGAVVFCDIYVGKKIDEINGSEEYSSHGVSVESYKYQAGWVVTWTNKDSLTDKFSDEIARFCEVYNVGYKSKIYADYPKDENGKDIKTDGYINPDGSPVTYDKEADAYYSPNGLYADGYVFGVKQALKVIIDYYEAQENIRLSNPIYVSDLGGEYVKVKGTGEMLRYKTGVKYVMAEDGETRLIDELKSQNKVEGYYSFEGYRDPEEVLQEKLAELESNPNSEWNKYKKTEEYLDAYGTDGTAYKFMFNETRLKTLVATLFSGVGNMKALNSALSLVSNVGVNVDSLLQEHVGITVADIKTMTLDGLLEVLNEKLSPALREKIEPLLAGFGIEFPVTTADVMGLVNSLFYYQSPTTKPIFMFLEDEELVRYATAKYEGITHGSNVGSVLLPTESTEIEYYVQSVSDEDAADWISKTYPTIRDTVVVYSENDDGSLTVVRSREVTKKSNVGKVLMGANGYPAEFAFTLQEALQLRADDSVAVPYYPLMVARRFLLVFSGVIAATYVVCFYDNRRAHEYAAAIDNA